MTSCKPDDSCCGTINSSVEPDVFASSGTFGDVDGAQETPEPVEVPVIEYKNIEVDTKFLFSVALQLPKFSKGYTASFFDEFIKANVDDEFVGIGRLSFPNEWQLTVKNRESREKLLRIRKTKLHGRTCWIRPLSNLEIRGNLHWVPLEVPNSALLPHLGEYGEVLYLEFDDERKDFGDLRRFSIYLKKGLTKNHLPHFIYIDDTRALITVLGREPMCFHCRDIGHRKIECIKYQLKMHDMGNGSIEDREKLLQNNKRGKRYKNASKKIIPVQEDCTETQAKMKLNSKKAGDLTILIEALNSLSNKPEAKINAKNQPLVEECLNDESISTKPESQEILQIPTSEAPVEKSCLNEPISTNPEPQEILRVLTSEAPIAKRSKNKKKKKKKH